MTSGGGGEGLAVVDRFYELLGSGDIDGCIELFSSDAVVWHNYDATEVTATEALNQLRGLAASGSNIKVISRDAISSGFVQRHVITRQTASGETMEMFAVHFLEVSNGKISRINEYFDLGQAGRLASS